MERLETKKISGHTYYYYSEWGWVNGKCRRKWQRYLGKLEDIVKACEGGGPAPLYADVFQWGLPAALWKEVCTARIVEEIDALCPKRNQGLSTGEYISLASVNRAIRPNSKRSMWSWFSQTVLLRYMPLFYDVYEGSRNDAKQFPLMLEKFNAFLQDIRGLRSAPEDTTLIFDKGNNSPANFEMIDSMGLKFVGSAKLGEHKELAQVPNGEERFRSFEASDLDGIKAFRVKKTVYGKERVLVVSYNQNLFDSQWLTLQNDISRAIERLAALQQKLRDRASGLIQGGRAPTVASVEKHCEGILSRQHMKQVITTTIRDGKEKIPELEYAVDAVALSAIADTHLGKNIIISNRESWDDARIIEAYRSQFIIENVFKEKKDRTTGNWWPMNHWTDSKIAVHALYCTIALLLRALMLRRVEAANMHLSMKRLLSELDNMRQVINIFPKTRRQKTERRQAVLSRTSELQDKLIDVLALKKEQNALLG